MEHGEDIIIPIASENEGKGDEEITVGMKVHSEEEAYNLYNGYALKKGFGIRKGNKNFVLSGDLRTRDFLCFKAGVSNVNDKEGLKKRKRVDSRTKCEAKIRFTIEDGVWTVSFFDDNHNHDFLHGVEKQFLRSGRKITDAYQAVISNMVEAGVIPANSYSFLSKEVGGGAAFVGFTKTDVQNSLQKKKAEVISGGDGQSLINCFKEQEAKDPNFFYSVQVDRCNRPTNFFWRDGISMLDYNCFGDVVVFDTTFRTNNGNLICASFVGVNHHRKNVLFGCAFLLDETTESFVWLFETFLQSMGNQKPKTIFTDEDKGMANATEIVLPETHHRLCTWHISKNATQHLPSYYAIPEFKKQFNKCLYACHDEAEFETEWNDMIGKFNLQSHSWLKKLYSLRMKWCPAFTLDIFSAGIRSTQRSESTNNMFHGFSTKTMEHVKFVHHCEEKTKELRNAEYKEDFRCKIGEIHPATKSGMLNHAANVYTIKMFSFFEKQFLSCLGVRLRQISNVGEVDVYEAIMEDSRKRAYTVQYFSLTCKVCCTCKLFESMGMLCCHALKVLDMKNFTYIPEHYILKRWTKKENKGIVISSSSKSGNSCQSLRLSELMHEGNNVFSIASMTESGTEIMKKKLAEALELIENEMEYMESTGTLNKEGGQAVDDNEGNDEPPVLNPTNVRAKGVTNARITSNLEKRKVSKRTSTSHKSRLDHMFSGQQATTCALTHPTSQASATFYPTLLYQFGVPLTPNYYNKVTSQGLPFSPPLRHVHIGNSLAVVNAGNSLDAVNSDANLLKFMGISGNADGRTSSIADANANADGGTCSIAANVNADGGTSVAK